MGDGMSKPRYRMNGKELCHVGGIDFGLTDKPALVIGEVTSTGAGQGYTVTFEAKIVNDGPDRSWRALIYPSHFTAPACQRGIR
jgi:hypothetical protein